jgi:hypothetical protein
VLGNGGNDCANRTCSAEVRVRGTTGEIIISAFAVVSDIDIGVVETIVSDTFSVAIFCPLLDTDNGFCTAES